MRAIGIILAGGNSSKMGELSAKRAVAAMPVTGSYRAIDFSLIFRKWRYLHNTIHIHYMSI